MNNEGIDAARFAAPPSILLQEKDCVMNHILLENDVFSLTLGEDCASKSLILKSTGEDLLAEHKDICIFTNSVQVLLSAANFHISCYLTGGKYYEKDMCLLGAQAEKYAENINTDIAFFSCAGYSEDGRITDDSEEQTAVRLAAMKHAKKKIMLFDSTKKEQIYAFTVCQRDDLYKMITIH